MINQTLVQMVEGDLEKGSIILKKDVFDVEREIAIGSFPKKYSYLFEGQDKGRKYLSDFSGKLIANFRSRYEICPKSRIYTTEELNKYMRNLFLDIINNSTIYHNLKDFKIEKRASRHILPYLNFGNLFFEKSLGVKPIIIFKKEKNAEISTLVDIYVYPDQNIAKKCFENERYNFWHEGKPCWNWFFDGKDTRCVSLLRVHLNNFLNKIGSLK